MSAAAPAHSFRRRFTYKLAANVVGVLLAFLQSVIVSRALGPRAYGNYNFLATFFIQLVAFLEVRSSTYLFTTLSSNRENRGVVAFYAYLALAISALTLLVPAIAIALGASNALWPDQDALVVLLVAVLALVLWYSDLLTKLCDAFGLTVSLETARTINAAIFFTILLLLMHWNLIDLRSYIGFQFVLTASLIAALALLLRRAGTLAGQPFRPGAIDMRGNLRELFAYSNPLFVYTLIGLATTYADRWLLQWFGGSVQQGLFSLALNIGLAFNVFINALHPLMMREFAMAFAADDLARARDLFRRLIPASYTLSAFFLCYAAVYAESFVRIMGGAAFREAAAVFAVMAFLPILHNYSMLSGSVLYASNKTRLLRNIGLATMPLSIAATFFLIAPAKYGGLALGSTGLAIKMVALEFIGNNVILFYNARLLKLSFPRYLLHQVGVVAVLTVLAFLCRQAAAHFVHEWLMEMIAGGVLYAVLCIALLQVAPSFAGIDRREAIETLRSWFRNGSR